MAVSRDLASPQIPAIPPSWMSSDSSQEFLQLLHEAAAASGAVSQPILICDYDGTLAPFCQDKMQAYPYQGVVERLNAIVAQGTKLAFVSGRPVDELVQLLPLAAEAEIWGMHGREHRLPGSRSTLLEPTVTQRTALDTAEAMLRSRGAGDLLERKVGSIALHWRTIEATGNQARLEEVQQLAKETFAPLAGEDALALLPFDGGLELRIADHTKGHATQALLSSVNAWTAAFLGDDTTDEDAFQAIRARGGLALLVREPSRNSHAQFSLKPPDELLSFLDQWLAATTLGGATSTRFVH